MQIKNTRQQILAHTGETSDMKSYLDDYTIDDEVEFELTDEELQELEERSQRRISGESKTYTWEQVKNYIFHKKELL